VKVNLLRYFACFEQQWFVIFEGSVCWLVHYLSAAEMNESAKNSSSGKFPFEK
jgi:hypothetical protein